MLAIRNISRFRGRRSGPLAIMAAGLTMLACLHANVLAAVAQKPVGKELRGFPDPPDFARKKLELFNAGKAADESDSKLFDDHYKFVIAEMTLPGSYDKLAAKRESLKQKDLVPLGRAPNPELHSRLTNFLVTMLPRLIADSEYLPAVRVNWTLILGDLNATEPQFGKGDVPLPEALPELQKLYIDEHQHIAVRLAALVGIARHVEKSNLSADTRQRLAQAMTAIIEKKKPTEFGQDVHDFFRRRTIDALRGILDVAPDTGDAAVATALADFTADAAVRLHYRCEAAAALGMLEGRSFKKEDVPELARVLANLAVQITKPPAAPPVLPSAVVPPAGVPPVGVPPAVPPAAAPPAADAPPAQAPAAEGPPAAAPPGAPARVAAAPAHHTNASRSREVQGYFLACVRQGFKGSKPNRGLLSVAVEPDTKKLVDELSAKVDEMLRLVTDTRGVPDADLSSQLVPVNEGLQAMIKIQGTGKTSPEPGSSPMQIRDKQ
jgi:hypothetical protein